MTKQEFTMVDLFCGAGIGALGFKEAGYHILWALDNNPFAIQTYNKNIGNHAVCKDIRKVRGDEIPDHDVMVATPVCKSFSVAGKGNGMNDEKNGDLALHFIRLLKEKMPKAFIFENVSGMVSRTHRGAFDMLLKEWETLGYNLSWELVNCNEYGVPQDRKRVFVVGIRMDFGVIFKFPEKVDTKTSLRDAIGDLPEANQYCLIPNHNEWYDGGFSSRYLSRNRQRQWDEPSFCIVSEARQLPLHPEPPNYDIRVKDLEKEPPPRRLTVRECLRIQTVPDSFIFDESIPLNKQYERCSGIPTKVAYLLGMELKKQLA